MDHLAESFDRHWRCEPVLSGANANASGDAAKRAVSNLGSAIASGVGGSRHAQVLQTESLAGAIRKLDVMT
jgi:hypothetical protein